VGFFHSWRSGGFKGTLGSISSNFVSYNLGGAGGGGRKRKRRNGVKSKLQPSKQKEKRSDE